MFDYIMTKVQVNDHRQRRWLVFSPERDHGFLLI